MAQETKQAVFLGSVLLNIILIGIFIWFVGYSRSTMLKLVADAANNQIELQERILTELASGDSDRIAALTNSLHWSIEAQKRIRYKIETKDYRPDTLP